MPYFSVNVSYPEFAGAANSVNENAVIFVEPSAQSGIGTWDEDRAKDNALAATGLPPGSVSKPVRLPDDFEPQVSPGIYSSKVLNPPDLTWAEAMLDQPDRSGVSILDERAEDLRAEQQQKDQLRISQLLGWREPYTPFPAELNPAQTTVPAQQNINLQNILSDVGDPSMGFPSIPTGKTGRVGGDQNPRTFQPAQTDAGQMAMRRVASDYSEVSGMDIFINSMTLSDASLFDQDGRPIMPQLPPGLLEAATLPIREYDEITKKYEVVGYQTDPAVQNVLGLYQNRLLAINDEMTRRTKAQTQLTEQDRIDAQRAFDRELAAASNTSAENIARHRKNAEVSVALKRMISEKNVADIMAGAQLDASAASDAAQKIRVEVEKEIADITGTKQVDVANAYADAQTSVASKALMERKSDNNRLITIQKEVTSEVIARIDAGTEQQRIALQNQTAQLEISRGADKEEVFEKLRIANEEHKATLANRNMADERMHNERMTEMSSMNTLAIERLKSEVTIANENRLSMSEVATIQFGSANEVARLEGRYGLEAEEIRAQSAENIAGTTGWHQQTIANISAAAAGRQAEADEYAAAAGALGQVEASRYGLAPEDYMDLQKSLARGGLDPTQRLQLGRIQYTGGLESEPFQQMQETLARGGLTAEQLMQQEQIRATGGLTAEDYHQMQLGLARGGLSAEERLAEQRLAAAPQVLSTLTGLLGDPSAVGTLQSLGGGLSGIMQPFAPQVAPQAAMPAGSPVGTAPPPLGAAATPLATTPAPLATTPPPVTQQEVATQQMGAGAFATPSLSTLPRIPTLASLGRLSDEEKRRQQGFMAGRGVTPSLLGNLVRSVTPRGPQATSVVA